MASISLARVDYRLVHGQVVVRWIKEKPIDRIVVVDDVLSQNEMMRKVYRMGAPSNYGFSMMSTDAFIREFNGGAFGEERLMVLFQTVASVHQAVRSGLKLDAVQLGNCAKKPKNVGVCKYIFIDQSEFLLLKEMKDMGITITMQNIPTDPMLSYSVIEKKMSK